MDEENSVANCSKQLRVKPDKKQQSGDTVPQSINVTAMSECGSKRTITFNEVHLCARSLSMD